MGKSVPVTLGRFTYSSKGAAIEALRAIRDALPDRAPLLDDDAVDLLMGVVAAHPQAAEKVGVGIAGFFAAKSPDFPSRCFYLIRTDGSETEFSWNEAITPTQPIFRLRMACRNAIEDQKTAFKNREWPRSESGTKVCAITGEWFDRASAHVDHQPPKTLARLVDDWLAAEGVSISDVMIDHTGDLRSVDTFADDCQRDSWRAFHTAHANLRVVSAAGNLRQVARILGLEPTSFGTGAV
jgi:hypothetical protein